MDAKLLNLQTKGQIMLPKVWRDDFGATTYKAIKTDKFVILYPVDVPSDEEVMQSAKKIMDEHETLFRSLAQK